MMVPIGVEGATVRRMPWVSITIASLCALCFLLTWVLPSNPEGPSDEELEQVLGYWMVRPYLEPSTEFQKLIHPQVIAQIHHAQASFVEETTPEPHDAEGSEEGNEAAFPADEYEEESESEPAEGTPGVNRAGEQAELDRRVSQVLEQLESSLLRRWGLVPARGAAQPGWLTHMFLHLGWMHLLGNLLFFYLVGPMLEDVWGRPLFVGAYLVGGLAAAAAHAGLDPSSSTLMVGASGAIAACMGAFTLRFAAEKIRMAYMFFFMLKIFRGTFLMPAWLWGGLWFGSEVLSFVVLGNNTGVAVMAHIGGFAFGFATAALVRMSGLERKVIAPLLEEGTAWEQNPHILAAEEALLRNDAVAARTSYEQALRTDPSNITAEAGLAKLDLQNSQNATGGQRTERALVLALTRKDDGQLWRVLEDLGPLLPVESVRPQTAYRVAQLIENGPDWVRAQAERWYTVAGAGAGLMGAKALIRAAELRMAQRAPSEPTVALLDKALAVQGLSPELSAKARELRGGLTESFQPLEDAATLPPPTIFPGRLLRVVDDAVEIEFENGEAQSYGLNQFTAISVALIQNAPAPAKPVLMTDLVLAFGDASAGAQVIRIASMNLGLSVLYPGVTPGAAYQKLLQHLTAQTGTQILPDADATRAGKFARFSSQNELDTKLYGKEHEPTSRLG
jgi:membrane associated rhomboid family serine protease